MPLNLMLKIMKDQKLESMIDHTEEKTIEITEKKVSTEEITTEVIIEEKEKEKNVVHTTSKVEIRKDISQSIKKRIKTEIMMTYQVLIQMKRTEISTEKRLTSYKRKVLL